MTSAEIAGGASADADRGQPPRGRPPLGGTSTSTAATPTAASATSPRRCSATTRAPRPLDPARRRRRRRARRPRSSRPATGSTPSAARPAGPGARRPLESYDPRRGRWRKLPAMDVPREHIAAAAAAGRIYVLGGRSGGAQPARRRALRPASTRWRREPLDCASPAADSPPLTVAGKIVAFGGEELAPAGTTIRPVELFDPRPRPLVTPAGDANAAPRTRRRLAGVASTRSRAGPRPASRSPSRTRSSNCRGGLCARDLALALARRRAACRRPRAARVREDLEVGDRVVRRRGAVVARQGDDQPVEARRQAVVEDLRPGRGRVEARRSRSARPARRSGPSTWGSRTSARSGGRCPAGC